MASLPITDFIPRIQYTATPGQTVYVVPFPFMTASDLEVYVTPALSIASDYFNKLILNTQYTVTQNNTFTGSITLNIPSIAGEVITIVRAMPDQRINYYLPGGAFTAEAVNTDFISQVLMIQQNQMYDKIVAPHYNLSSTPLQPNILGGQDIILPVLKASEAWVKDPTNNFITTTKIGAGDSISSIISQVGHGFVVGEIVYFNGLAYVRAMASNDVEAEVIGIVSEVLNIDSFRMTTAGLVAGLNNLIPGNTYFLSNVASGALTLNQPSIVGHISKPLLISVSPTVGYFFNFRGKIIPAPLPPAGVAGTQSVDVTQNAHGFSAKDVLRFDGALYTLALADNETNAEVIGMVGNVIDANNFTLITGGLVTLSGVQALPLVPGVTYFLSDVNPGFLSPIEPISPGSVSKPLFIALSSSSGYFFNFRGKLIPDEIPVRTTASRIHQAAHGFTVGQALYYNGGQFTLALADTVTHAEAIGVVSYIEDTDTFDLTITGYFESNDAAFTNFVPGATYFLSDTTPGRLSLVEPTNPGFISKPMFLATSPTTGYVFNMRGQIIPAPAFSWQNVLNAQNMTENNGYISTNTFIPVFFSLPTQAKLGSKLHIAGFGAGGWHLSQNAGQKIHFGNLDTTTGSAGYLSSTNPKDCVELLCVIPDLEFLVISSIGAVNVI